MSSLDPHKLPTGDPDRIRILRERLDARIQRDREQKAEQIRYRRQKKIKSLERQVDNIGDLLIKATLSNDREAWRAAMEARDELKRKIDSLM